MRLTFLGTGTSFGVPVVGCDCPVCTSPDPRDRRTRHGSLLSLEDGRTVLVDTPPELRLQLLREGAVRVDAVWFTHVHADHLHGIDDLRIFSLRSRQSVPAFCSESAREVLRRRFEYVFSETSDPEDATLRPEISLHTVRAGRPTVVAGRRFLPLAVPHGRQEVFGFRVGRLGYITDAKDLPPATLSALRGVHTLVLNALWWGNPHPNHFNVEEAVSAALEVGAERTFLVHLSHRVGHEDLLGRLPEGITPAYDGLTVEIPDEQDDDGLDHAQTEEMNT